MIVERTERETRRLRRIAERLQNDGFDVTIEPRGAALPRWLHSFSPDLIAVRGDEGVIVEVKSRDEVHGDKSLRRLAEIVEDHPTWRLELDISNPREATDVEEAFHGPASEPQIQEYLHAAGQLMESELQNPALLSGWAGFEGAARRALAPREVDLTPMPIGALLKALRTFGYINVSSYERLRALSNVRNQVAHGAKPPRRTRPTDIAFLRDVAMQLLRAA